MNSAWSVKIESFSAAEPVVAQQLVAQEHRRSGHREDVRRIDLVDVEHRALVLRLALEVREVLLRLVREVVDHRPPDRAGELREVRLGLAERQQLVQVERVRVVLVQDAGGAVVDRQARVADRAVGGGAEGRDHDPQSAALDDLARLRVGDVGEAEVAQIRLEVVGRVVGQQHLDVLGDVPSRAATGRSGRGAGGTRRGSRPCRTSPSRGSGCRGTGTRSRRTRA